MTGIAQDEAKARQLGISYGMLKALPVYVRRYEEPQTKGGSNSVQTEPRYCLNCGKPLKGRRRTYCDAVCSNRFRGRKYYTRKTSFR